MLQGGRLFCTYWIATCLLPAAALAWEPAKGPLMTRWSKDVSPQNALPEYPRPQMVRKESSSGDSAWVNLNGLWQYAIRPAKEERPTEWDGEILVPYPIESALSGVSKSVQPDEKLWYRRTFATPQEPAGNRCLLHFGAVDWKTTVWVNGQLAGEHAGGFDPFTFDITPLLNTDSDENELVVAVTDPTDTGTQPRGKQVLKPHGIYYTAVTGIWQTVWLETVPENYIKSFTVTPDIDREVVRVKVTTNEASKETNVGVRVLDGGEQVAEAEGTAGQEIEVSVSKAKLWSPDNPHLYDLEVTLLDGEKASDKVTSYFGMRKIEVKKDDDGLNRLWLNKKVAFQYGPLDQGWWPDGLYTAPTDEALKYDIEVTKQLGFNMARKHVKVEPARWYYWCDKLGLLVWQDMPSGDFDETEESRENYRRELKAMIDALYHFPSIVMWIPFNEGWGQHDTEDVVEWIQNYDPSRPVNEASGWHDRGSGDVADMHNYPGPGMRAPEPDRVVVLGEFGGLGLPIGGHTWQDEKNWGYVSYDSPKALTDAYVQLLTMMRPLIGQGLAAAVYTQTTDVEIEVNGLLTYDRAIIKMEEDRIVEAAKKLYEKPPAMRVLSPTSEASPQDWQYTTKKPGKGWNQLDYDDSDWKTGPAGFGAGDRPRSPNVIRTPWTSSDIWIRRTFDVESPEVGRLLLIIQHDEDAEIYLNGERVRKMEGHTRHYKPVLLNKSADKHLRSGRNVLAVHCRQTTGGQFIDAGLSAIESEMSDSQGQ